MEDFNLKIPAIGSGGLHLRMNSFRQLYFCLWLSFGDPVTALALAVVVTVFLENV